MKINDDQDPYERARSYETVMRGLNVDPSYHLLLKATELDQSTFSHSLDIEAVLKDLLLYSPTSIVLGETEWYTTTIGGTTINDDRRWESDIPAFQRIRAVTDEIGAPHIIFLPEKIVEGISDYGESDHWDEQYEREHFNFFTTYANKNGLPMSPFDPALQNRWSRDGVKPQVLRVWLPSLRDVPLKQISSLRVDEQDRFENLHATLRKLVTHTGNLTTAERTRELLQEVHDGVRNFDSQMREFKRRGKFKVGEVVFGAVCMGLTFVVPSDAAQVILSVIGAYSAKDFIQDLFRHREDWERLKNSDFYVPWLLSHTGNSKSK